MRIKIFSYNVHGLPFILESWTTPLAEWFHGSDYDIVCLQEVFTAGRISLLTGALEENGYTVLKPDDTVTFFGSGLITAFRTDGWKIKGSAFEAFHDSIGAEQIVNKGFHWLHLEHISGTSLQLINTHLQADHPVNYIFTNFTGFREIRKKQATQILTFLKKLEQRSLIVGDINSEDEPHTDMVYLTGQRLGMSKHTFESTGEDLDHVVTLLGEVVPHVLEVAVLSKLWWSDHWPIHVLLEWERSSNQ
jgi:endonuclease/exonuclease/phosphatase family metal-dependent hydrolase